MAHELGAAHTGVLRTQDIVLSFDIRNMCRQNRCGKYAANWCCPPGVGRLEDLRARVLEYEKGLAVQGVYPLEDAYDYEGMLRAGESFRSLFCDLREKARQISGIGQLLFLGAGGCGLCPACAYTEGLPCRTPEKALSSVEAYGVDVYQLLKSCKIPVVNGENTIFYTGLVLFDKIKWQEA